MSTSQIRSLGGALFGGARRAVLTLLFTNPDESYYLRQIARITGLGLGAIQREVNRLAGAGILRRTVFVRQVHYQADAECPIFQELKSLILKTAGIADTLRSALLPLQEKIRVAFLFGSIARGDWKKGSDVDLLIVGDVSFEEAMTALGPAQTALRREVNPAVYSLEDFQSKLAARQHFLSSVLNREKIFLLGDEDELARLVPVRMARRA